MELVVSINSWLPLILDGSIEMPNDASGSLLWKLSTESVRSLHNFEQIDLAIVPFLSVVKDVFSSVGGSKHVTVFESHSEWEAALCIVQSVFFRHGVDQGAWILERSLHCDLSSTQSQKHFYVILFEGLLKFFAMTTIFPA